METSCVSCSQICCGLCSQICYGNFVKLVSDEMEPHFAKINKGLRSGEKAWIQLLKIILNNMETIPKGFRTHCSQCNPTKEYKGKMYRTAAVIYLFELLIDYKKTTTKDDLFQHNIFPGIVKDKLFKFEYRDIPVSTLWKGSQYYYKEIFGVSMTI